MKSIVWLIYVSSIVIMRIKAAEHSAMCSMCVDPATPKCESPDNTKLDRTIDCKEQACVLAMDKETDYVCVLEDKSKQSSQLEVEVIDEQSQATVLPVPLALQMVTTEATGGATDTSKEIDNPADIGDNGNAEAEDNVQVEEQHAAAQPNEAQQENSDANDKSSEKVKEPQPVETEHNEDQEVAAGVEQITNVDGNAEATQVSSAEDVAEVQPVEQPAAVEPENEGPSPDYPADAPAINEGEANAEVQSPTATAEKPGDTEQTVPQNTNDINDADDEGDVNKDADTNKDEVSVNNYDEQNAMNSGVTTVVEHGDDSTSNVGEPEKPAADNAKPQGVESSDVANAPPNVIVDNTSPPVNANQLLSCYSCSSTTDAKCAPGPGRAMNCQPIENKQNGCYTLYKADTNVTTRGCISELTNEGLKYCKSNSKQCILCYDKACNNLLAPSAAIQSNSQLSLWLGLASFMLATFML
ncbi:enolase-phosphatase E1 isoform X1 [Bactrocera tryoni]|uniref:enolase-phosphatase E1 isoform X1 n=2 Tax=Bactrocera tryoni TaxID=59916 RepID=UPI001A966E34|nr:enolase-phosphatase E1 isoform X1 [Bactrocera tryoni]XP_039952946.1 enolase-phosphatase E1 isoform X1 [Bactrocera tryoni]XP_039952947.1 enolase-phosphatase E1 isoform X1 [Bactrocera tryoni]